MMGGYDDEANQNISVKMDDFVQNEDRFDSVQTKYKVN